MIRDLFHKNRPVKIRPPLRTPVETAQKENVKDSLRQISEVRELRAKMESLRPELLRLDGVEKVALRRSAGLDGANYNFISVYMRRRNFDVEDRIGDILNGVNHRIFVAHNERKHHNLSEMLELMAKYKPELLGLEDVGSVSVGVQKGPVAPYMLVLMKKGNAETEEKIYKLLKGVEVKIRIMPETRS